VAEEIFGRDMKGLGNWLGGDLPDQSVFKHWNSQHRTSKANSFHYIPWTQVDRLFGLNLNRALRILDKQHAPRSAKRHSSLGMDLPWYQLPGLLPPKILDRQQELCKWVLQCLLEDRHIGKRVGEDLEFR